MKPIQKIFFGVQFRRRAGTHLVGGPPVHGQLAVGVRHCLPELRCQNPIGARPHE
jgi:hypothetical protein